MPKESCYAPTLPEPLDTFLPGIEPIETRLGRSGEDG